MSTERHVCSLEMSRRLAEAGFPQATVFAWWESDTEPGLWRVFANDDSPYEFTAKHAAPLLSEIMEQMPRSCAQYLGDRRWLAWDGKPAYMKTEEGPTGPDAAGALWLALRGGEVSAGTGLGLVVGLGILWGVWTLLVWTGLRDENPKRPAEPERDTDGADWIEGDKR